MSSSRTEPEVARARTVHVAATELAVGLSDGRTIIVPLDWYPRLLHGTNEERNNWRPIGDGEGIHWPDLDEDIEVDGLIAGARSGESQRSFQRWLAARAKSNRG